MASPVPETQIVHDHLNQCAEALLRALPPPLGQKALEDAKSQGLQPWQLIAGHLIKADQRAELHAPLLMPEWTVASATPGVSGQKICPSCKRVFEGPPERPDVRFCCNACGSGTFQKTHLHHERCEFFVRAVPVLNLGQPLVEIPPDPKLDPAGRMRYEQKQFAQHLEEVKTAEAMPGGLTAVPAPEDGVETLEVWRAPNR
jgi:hypothetical protein